MTLKVGLSLVAASIAASATAQDLPLQPVYLPERPNEVEKAAQAFRDCARIKIGDLEESMEPDAGAAAVVSACRAQLQRLKQAADLVILSSGLPEKRKLTARDELEERLNHVQARLSDTIRARRRLKAS
jgi:predicted dinucleotide-utilizing enzyme